jgi:prepilin signal peptidase PulO-like enzyme (type II secretory pathway)
MDFLFDFFVFILGAVVGSFLNVVIFRYNTGASIVGSKNRSFCFSCGKKLSWYELLPIASFFIQKGKCRGCRSRISWQYPIVEIITGFIFLLLFFQTQRLIYNQTIHSYPWFHFGYYAVIWCILTVITFYDFRHKIIPNFLVYGFILLSLLQVDFLGATYHVPLMDPLVKLNFLAGPIFFAAFFALWFVSRGTWIGFGDAKLVLGMGFLLGFVNGISAIALSFWIGAIVSIIMLSLGKLQKMKVVRNIQLPIIPKNLTIKSEIPFAPFLILGTAIAFFLGWDAIGLHLFI